MRDVVRAFRRRLDALATDSTQHRTPPRAPSGQHEIEPVPFSARYAAAERLSGHFGRQGQSVSARPARGASSCRRERNLRLRSRRRVRTDRPSERGRIRWRSARASANESERAISRRGQTAREAMGRGENRAGCAIPQCRRHDVVCRRSEAVCVGEVDEAVEQRVGVHRVVYRAPGSSATSMRGTPRRRPSRYRAMRSSASIDSHVSFIAWSQSPLSPSSMARSATGMQGALEIPVGGLRPAGGIDDAPARARTKIAREPDEPAATRGAGPSPLGEGPQHRLASRDTAESEIALDIARPQFGRIHAEQQAHVVIADVLEIPARTRHRAARRPSSAGDARRHALVAEGCPSSRRRERSRTRGTRRRTGRPLAAHRRTASGTRRRRSSG